MLWQNQEKRNQFDMKQGSTRDCFFLSFNFVSFRFLHTSQLSSHCLMKGRNETPHAHSWPPPRLAVLHSRATGANGRGTWKHCPWATTPLSSPKTLSSPSHLTCGVKTPGSSGDPASCCALPPGGMPTGDAALCHPGVPFSLLIPSCKKVSGWGPLQGRGSIFSTSWQDFPAQPGWWTVLLHTQAASSLLKAAEHGWGCWTRVTSRVTDRVIYVLCTTPGQQRS